MLDLYSAESPGAPSGDGLRRDGLLPNDPQPGRVASLISLLGDESPKVYLAAWNQLESLGAVAIPELQAAAVRSEEALIRLRSRKLLTGFRRGEVMKRWQEACSRGELDLETGAILISCIEYPDESGEDVRSVLEEYAAVLKQRLTTARTTESAVQKTIQLLCVELGFGGRGVLDYTDPELSYMHRVIERRVGLPILLAAVYLCVARRAGVSLGGVGMPHHFILKYQGTSGEMFLDPFYDGRILTRRDCKTLLERAGIPFQDSFLREVSDREILSRMLGNLVRVQHARQDRARLNRVIALVQYLEHDAEHGREQRPERHSASGAESGAESGTEELLRHEQSQEQD